MTFRSRCNHQLYSTDEAVEAPPTHGICYQRLSSPHLPTAPLLFSAMKPDRPSSSKWTFSNLGVKRVPQPWPQWEVSSPARGCGAGRVG